MNVETVIGHLEANSRAARRIVGRAIEGIPTKADWPEHVALDAAIITARDLWPPETTAALGPILTRFM